MSPATTAAMGPPGAQMSAPLMSAGIADNPATARKNRAKCFTYRNGMETPYQ